MSSRIWVSTARLAAPPGAGSARSVRGRARHHVADAVRRRGSRGRSRGCRRCRVSLPIMPGRRLAARASQRGRGRRCWAWVIATASASAASGLAASALGSSTFSMACRSAAFRHGPCPSMVFLTRLAAYSATGSPASAGTTSAMPRACPSFSVPCGSRLTKVSSTAASSGPMGLDDRRKPLVQRAQPLAQRSSPVRVDRAAGHEGEPRARRPRRCPSPCGGDRDRCRGCGRWWGS